MDYAGRGKMAPKVNAEFLKFLDDYPDRPFFAYLCYMDVNQALNHRRLNRGFWTDMPSQREVIQAYDHGLQNLDRQIGALFSELARRNVLNHSLVIITSDHGESFGAQSLDDHDPSGHGTSLYPEQTKVPLSVIFPQKIPAARSVNANVSLRQIAKTIAEVLRLKDSPFVGHSLPISSDPSNPLEVSEAPVLATLNYANQKVHSVVWRPWQYIVNGNHPSDGEEIYDLAADPLAKHRLEPKPAIVQQIREILQRLSNSGS